MALLRRARPCLDAGLGLSLLNEPLLNASLLNADHRSSPPLDRKLRPVTDFLLSPWSPPDTIRQALAAPAVRGGTPMLPPDWHAMLTEIRRQYPNTEFRTLGLARKPGDLITIRTRQPAEWLPNGRTTFWFDPATGQVVEVRNALTLPPAARIFNRVYPLHAARIGGLPYRLLMTIAGLSLALLGSLSVWTFWFRRPRKRR